MRGSLARESLQKMLKPKRKIMRAMRAVNFGVSGKEQTILAS